MALLEFHARTNVECASALTPQPSTCTTSALLPVSVSWKAIARVYSFPNPRPTVVTLTSWSLLAATNGMNPKSHARFGWKLAFINPFPTMIASHRGLFQKGPPPHELHLPVSDLSGENCRFSAPMLPHIWTVMTRAEPPSNPSRSSGMVKASTILAWASKSSKWEFAHVHGRTRKLKRNLHANFAKGNLTNLHCPRKDVGIPGIP